VTKAADQPETPQPANPQPANLSAFGVLSVLQEQNGGSTEKFIGLALWRVIDMTNKPVRDPA
jgi:hypothetical protein